MIYNFFLCKDCLVRQLNLRKFISLGETLANTNVQVCLELYNVVIEINDKFKSVRVYFRSNKKYLHFLCGIIIRFVLFKFRKTSSVKQFRTYEA